MLVKSLKVVLTLKKIKSFLQNLVSINDWLHKYFQVDRAQIVSYIILQSKKEPQKTHRNHGLQHFHHTEEEIEAPRNWLIYLSSVSGLAGTKHKASDSWAIVLSKTQSVPYQHPSHVINIQQMFADWLHRVLVLKLGGQGSLIGEVKAEVGITSLTEQWLSALAWESRWNANPDLTTS